MIFLALSHRVYGTPEAKRARAAIERYAKGKSESLVDAAETQFPPNDHPALDRMIDLITEVVVHEHAGHINTQMHDIVLRAFLAGRTVWRLEPDQRSLRLAVDLVIVDAGDAKIRYARLATTDRTIAI